MTNRVDKTSIQYSERGQQILERLSQDGLFTNKLAALQMAGIVGMALKQDDTEFKRFKSYEITRLSDIGALEEMVTFLYPDRCKSEHPLAIFEKFAEAGLVWLDREIREPGSYSLIDLLDTLKAGFRQRVVEQTGSANGQIGKSL